MRNYSILLCSLLSIILLLSACNPPRDRRVTRNEQYVTSDSDTSTTTDPAPNTPATDPDNGDDDTGTTPTPVVDYVPGMDHCQFAMNDPNNPPSCIGASHCTNNQYRFTHSHLGQGNGYNICQNSQDNKKIHIQLKSSLTDAKLCIIPTSNRNGLTVFVGEPRCLMMSEADNVYEVPLLTNRVGFESLSINGVMLIRDKSYFYSWPFNQYLLAPDAFVFCSQWLDNYSDPSYCNTFNAVGEYIYHQF
jgi:hypothetical protein